MKNKRTLLILAVIPFMAGCKKAPQEDASNASSSEEQIVVDEKYVPKGNRTPLSTSLETLSKTLNSMALKQTISANLDVYEDLGARIDVDFDYKQIEAEKGEYGNEFTRNSGVGFTLKEGTNIYVAETDAIREYNTDPKAEIVGKGSGSLYYKGAHVEPITSEFTNATVTVYEKDGKEYVDLTDPQIYSGLEGFVKSLPLVEDPEKALEEIKEDTKEKYYTTKTPDSPDESDTHAGMIKWENEEGETSYEDSLAGNIVELADTMLAVKENILTFSEFFEATKEDDKYYVYGHLDTLENFKALLQRIQTLTGESSFDWETIDLGNNPKLRFMATFTDEEVISLAFETNLKIDLGKTPVDTSKDDIVFAIAAGLFAASPVEGYDFSAYSGSLMLYGGLNVTFGEEAPKFPDFSDYVSHDKIDTEIPTNQGE